MPMSLRLSASTDGADDAESIAQALEHCATLIRRAGGAPVSNAGEYLASTNFGPQAVAYDVGAGFAI